MSAIIKPCPFCGCPAELDARRPYRNIVSGVLEDAIGVYCTSCDAEVSASRSREWATNIDLVVAAWNRRAHVDDLAALVHRLARALRRAAPDHDLPVRALDYLARHGLQGSVWRE